MDSMLILAGALGLADILLVRFALRERFARRRSEKHVKLLLRMHGGKPVLLDPDRVISGR